MVEPRRVSASAPREDPPSSVRRSAPKSLIRVVFDAGGTQTEQLLAFISIYVTNRYSHALSQRVSVAAYELLENGLAYCSVANEVVFEMLDRDGYVELTVSNHAVPARISRLREQVARLRTDAAATYAEALQRSVAGGLTRSMLGLARVTHEARMELHLEESGGQVLVIARCTR